MCAITSLVLGLGLTTTACYIFLAILVLRRLRSSASTRWPCTCSFFYWGMLSAITPPVAIARSRLGVAGASAMKKGWESMGVQQHRLPGVLFVLNPALVLQGPSPWLPALGLTMLITIGTLFNCGGIQGYRPGIGNLHRTGLLEWPLCMLLGGGGLLLATPGGGRRSASAWRSWCRPSPFWPCTVAGRARPSGGNRWRQLPNLEALAPQAGPSCPRPRDAMKAQA
jgi:Tripartite ATP-independent periplasmic transporter, DctM component